MLSTTTNAVAICGTFAPAGTYAAYVMVSTGSEQADLLTKAVELGVGGLLVALVTVPLVKWLLRRLDKQAEQVERLLDTLTNSTRVSEQALVRFARFENEEMETHGEIISQLNKLAATIERLVQLVEDLRRWRPEP